AGGAKKKTVDVCTQRIRSASKIVNQLKFIQATLLDTNTKALREQGVEEDRLMDTSLQLGDDASAVRMIYGCLDRMHIVALLGVGCAACMAEGGPSAGLAELEGDVDLLQTKVSTCLQNDGYLVDKASNAQPYVMIRDPDNLFHAQGTAEEVMDKEGP
ncbi:unnamed protein product, partial [Effrenium voratum]